MTVIQGSRPEKTTGTSSAQRRSAHVGSSRITSYNVCYTKLLRIPAVGHANFHIEDGQMEVGIGHHGEPGINVTDIVPADQMARIMVDTVLPDLPFAKGDRVAVLISGLGATPVMEQYILYASVAKYLGEAGITVAVPLVGNFFTSLEMMGVTLSVLKLDDQLEGFMKAPCASIGITQK